MFMDTETFIFNGIESVEIGTTIRIMVQYCAALWLYYDEVRYKMIWYRKLTKFWGQFNSILETIVFWLNPIME